LEFCRYYNSPGQALESETPPAIDVKVEVKPTTKVEARTPTKTLNTDPRKGDVWEIDDFSDIEEVPRDKISPNVSHHIMTRPCAYDSDILLSVDCPVFYIAAVKLNSFFKY
jgi:hypothetical protein